MAELMDKFDAALVRLHPVFLDNLVDQIVLAVPETVHGFGLRRIVWASLGEPDTARCQKVANAVVAGLAIHIEPIVRGDIEGTKCLASLHRSLLKILVKHLFPARRVYAGGVGDHAVEVEQHGIVLVSGDRTLALRLPPRSPAICFAHNIVLPISPRSVGRRPLTSERPVPDLHSGNVAVVAEDTQGPRIEQKMLPGARGQPDPPRDERTQDVTMREHCHVARSGARPGDDPIRPDTDLFRCLTARTTVAKNQPAGPGLVDLCRGQPLVFTVIPFGQFDIDNGRSAQTRQFAGLARTLHGAAENERKPLLGEHRAQSLGEAATILGQGDVSRAGVLSAQAPRRFAVSDREDVHFRPVPGQTLSASVDRTPAEAASCPHLHPLISGMSSPYRVMNSLCSMSLSRIVCFA